MDQCVLTAQSLFNLVKLPYIFQRRLSSTDKLMTASNLLNVSPPWNAPSWVWKLAWNLHQAAIPILHLFDRCQSKESFVNLPVLWWKAISGNRKHSVGFDHGFAYDLLPGVARTIVAYPLCYLYPPLHHQNVLLRTVYLDQCILRALNETYVAMSQRNPIKNNSRIILISFFFLLPITINVTITLFLYSTLTVCTSCSYLYRECHNKCFTTRNSVSTTRMGSNKTTLVTTAKSSTKSVLICLPRVMLADICRRTLLLVR